MPKIILNKQPIKTSFCTAVLLKILPILVGLSLCTLNLGQLSASTFIGYSAPDAEALEVLAEAYISDPCITPSCTYSYSSGSCSNYTVNAGETLCILGDYTSCSVTLAGGTVYIAPGVTFAPTMGGTIQGTIINCGNSVFNAVSFSPGSTVQNFGNMSFSGSINLNGNVDFINGEGAELNFDSNFSLDQSSTLVSDGRVSITGSFIVKNGTSFTNNFELETTGNFTTNNGGITINNGRVTSSGGDININTGASVINNCSFSATNHIIINEDLENNGLLYSLSGVGNITINNAATLTNNGNVVSNSLTINGSAEGSGAFWHTGNTYLNSAGSFGTDGLGLNIHDSSTPPGTQFFDVQNGILDGSATNNPSSLANPIPIESDLASTCSALTRNCTGSVDSDSDGVSDICDLDDDNDGIPDTDECPGLSSGLTGPLMSFTTDISTADESDATTPHTLNSITYAGETYSDFIVPSSFSSNYSLTSTWGIRYILNNGEIFNYSTASDYDTDILPAFTSRNIGAYQGLDGNDFSDGDYYDLGYAEPVISNTGGFIAVTERAGNNPQVVSALDENGIVFGTPITVANSDYVDLGVVVHQATTSRAFMALYPIDNLAPVGSQIHGLRISFGPTATTDGPDAKVFIFGSSEALACDADNDGVPNYLDLDSDNDGIFDLIEAGHEATDTNNDGVIDGNSSSFGTNGLSNSVETSPNSGNLNYTIKDSESIGDGVYDAYELDADGDLCFDTEEALISDTDNDGIAGSGSPSVNIKGKVYGSSYANPTNTNWQNHSIRACIISEVCNDGIDNDGDGNIDCIDTECDCTDNCDSSLSGLLDTDGDNVADICDLDDDNDGIPDLNEGICETISGSITAWLHNNIPVERGDNLNPAIVNSVSDISFGPGLGAYFDASQIAMSDIDQGNLSAAISDGDYLEYVFSTGDIKSAYLISDFLMTKHGGGSSGTPDNYGYDLTIRISADNFATHTTMENRFTVDTDMPTNFQTVTLGVGDINHYIARPNTSYTIRVYFYNKTTTANVDGWFDDFSVRATTCQISYDTDGDGIENHLDLDSDNDGIYDLVEAGHSAIDSNNDGMIDGSPVLFGSNGLINTLETTAESGILNYFIKNSEPTWDPIYDAYEIDSDDDGCPDVLEAGYSDDDYDGELGNSNVSVNSDGVVTSGSNGYTGTTSYVTNPARQAGCPDNDNDFISDGNDDDDDNDGITDFTEFDCSSAWLAFNLTWSQNNAANDAIQIQRPSVIASGQPFTYGSGHSGVSTNRRVDIPTITSKTLAEAILNSEYIEYEFTTQNLTSAVVMGEMSHNKNPSSSGATGNSYGYNVGISISKDRFTTQQMLSYGYYIDETIPSGWDHDYMLGDNEDYQLEPSQTYTVRVYFFNKKTPGTARFDDFALLSYHCANSLDQDGDNTFNHKDLDSDGDLCFDVKEAGFTDGDNDGILGNSPVSVENSGRVNPRTDGYSTPRQTVPGTLDFLSAAVNASCVEICNNGTDDDGDGAIDCADDDCPSANTVTRVNRL